ncbi:unnamed protein product [Penicillium camemberti]|uniref:Str. FM013 n=1 Tax=Penicillium camemberti (strain FM 013) TaxID=1429867 RepID=A0A0G4PVC7_PENC3|nr:unnamed protein product [Penicillium camemberti]
MPAYTQSGDRDKRRHIFQDHNKSNESNHTTLLHYMLWARGELIQLVDDSGVPQWPYASPRMEPFLLHFSTQLD